MREEQIIHSALITLTTLTTKTNKAFDFNYFNYSNSFNYYNKQYFPNSAVLYLKWIKTKVKTATDMC